MDNQTPNNFVKSKNKERPMGEIYEDIVDVIHKMYDNKLTHKEAHDAARNLIGFCKKAVEISARQTK